MAIGPPGGGCGGRWCQPRPLASGMQGSRQSGLHVGRLPPMLSGWSVPVIKLNNPTGGSPGPARPAYASPCPRAPTRPGADSQSAPRAGAGRAPACPLPIGPASAPQADQAGPAGQAGPRRGGERRRPALGTPPDRATQKREKRKSANCAGRARSAGWQERGPGEPGTCP